MDAIMRFLAWSVFFVALIGYSVLLCALVRNIWKVWRKTLRQRRTRRVTQLTDRDRVQMTRERQQMLIDIEQRRKQQGS